LTGKEREHAEIAVGTDQDCPSGGPQSRCRHHRTLAGRYPSTLDSSYFQTPHRIIYIYTINIGKTYYYQSIYLNI
jgi:hypothetical protein